MGFGMAGALLILYNHFHLKVNINAPITIFYIKASIRSKRPCAFWKMHIIIYNII